ncbi:MAG TPA: catalase family protein [Allosphingosinicella sp.]|nr:catalase family protein [Allosphingosinicella sp.]
MRLLWLHELLTWGLLLERRFEPFFRRAFNTLFRNALAAALQWAINLSRKDEKLALAEETIQPNEERDVQNMIDTMRDHLIQDFPPEKMERAGNTKTHGVVRAEFIVHDDLPEKLRHGIFARPGRYKAWARFSNPGPHVEPDIDDVGFVSLGLKVMGVEGPKLMDDETGTQDFLAICVPTFPTPDVSANADLQLWSKRELPIWYFLNPRKHHIRDFLMQSLWNETQYNPLGHNYYSCVPYLLGEGQAMQYAFFGKSKVHDKIPRVPFRPPDNYLRDNMVKTLLETDVELEMTVQLQTDSYRMPIENASVLWPTRLSPRIPVATLRIPRQRFDSPEQLAFARNLSFNPWHCLPEHRPLGNQSRARKRMYQTLAQFRQKNNQVPHIEPTSWAPFG